MGKTYLQWLSQETATKFWHDSANPDEIERGIAQGALGVTTNPVLTYKTLIAHPDYWKPKLEGVLRPDMGFEERAEALLRVVACDAAARFMDIYKKSEGTDGYALGQLNPSKMGDAEAMLEQAHRYHRWADNIMIKLPATQAGIEVVQQLAAEGIPVCCTINISTSQAIAVAQAYEKGRKRALESGIRPAPCLVVQQIGRLDDYIRDVAMDSRASLSEDDVRMAGMAVFKRTYAIFQREKYASTIIPCAFRGAYHIQQLSGANVTITIHPRVQAMLQETDLPHEEGISQMVDPAVVSRLMTIPEFAKAYEPDGMKPYQFIGYGVVQRMLSQFIETGWALLEEYGVAESSGRWT